MKRGGFLINSVLGKFSLEIFSFFLIFVAVNFLLYSFFCVTPLKFNFDSQIPLTWELISSKNFLPYRDIFFPYGILFYLKQDSVLLESIYTMLLPLLFVLFLFFFKKLWKDNLFSYLSFSFFTYFIVVYTGIESFRRYGIISAFGLLFSFIFSKQEKINFLTSGTVGVLIGITFSLVNDQGGYALLLYLFLLFINPILRNGINGFRDKKYYKYFLSRTFSFALGTLLGFLPFLIYLLSNKILVDFFRYLLELRDFPIYAKTPFIPFSATSDNLFTFTILFLSIFYICHRIANKKNFSLSFYSIFNIVIVLILLEQKSLIRSMDRVITFLAALLFIVLGYELSLFLKSKKVGEIKIFSCYILLMFVILFKLNLNSFGFSRYVLKDVEAEGSCSAANLNAALPREKKYEEVVQVVKNDPMFSGKIFNYFSDPIFYVLFKQKPPYFFTMFEATPLYAQKENIKYIENNNVSHVIYSEEVIKLQDNVPDYARQKMLFKYILNNFSVEKKVDDFFIFRRRDRNIDFFSSTPESLKDYFLTINLAAIPRSEGLYKSKEMFKKKNYKTIFSGSAKTLNTFLAKNNINSSNKVLIIYERNYQRSKKTSIKLTTNDSKSTNVSFYSCDINVPCIVNLANVPLFYKERVLKEIVLDDSFEGYVDIVSMFPEENDLW